MYLSLESERVSTEWPIPPEYTTTFKTRTAPPGCKMQDLFNPGIRFIAIDGVEDPAARVYLRKKLRRDLPLPDEGIGTCLYDVDARDCQIDDEDRKWLNFGLARMKHCYSRVNTIFFTLAGE